MNINHRQFLSPGHQLLVAELTKRNIKLHRVPGTTVLFLSDGETRHIMMGNYTSLVPYNVGLIISNKYFCREICKNAGVSVAEGEIFPSDRKTAALRFAKNIGYPIILRQENSQSDEKGCTDIKNDEAFSDGFERLASSHETILVEKMFQGISLQVFITSEGLINVLKHVSNGVVSLITQGDYPRYEKKLFTGQNAKNIYQDITNSVHPDMYKIGKKILKVFSPMPYICFEILVKSSAQSFTASSYVVTEIFHSPNRHLRYQASNGKQKQPVVEIVANMLFPKKGRHEQPR